MLKALRVKDFAIIDEVHLEFNTGFTVFTGETGAGKSILVDAIGLIIGWRASSDIVRDGCDEAVIEAIFEDVEDAALVDKLDGYGIHAGGDEVIVRRNIARNGKGRIYINGSLSTLAILEDICSELVDIHGQHEQQGLLKKNMHLVYLDAFGNLSDIKKRVRDKYHDIEEMKNRLDRIENGVKGKKERGELWRFQLTEIKGAGLKEGEERELTLERDILNNSKKLSALSDEAYNLLYGDDRSILSGINTIEEDIDEVSRIDPKMIEVADMVRSSKANLREASEMIRRFRDNVTYDPERLGEIEERLYLIERLKKKYGQSVEEIIAYQLRIEKELEDMEYSGEDIKSLREEIGKGAKEIEADAVELSKLRKSASGELEKEVMHELSLLQMGNTRFVVNMEEVPLSQHGLDSVEFLIANINEEPRSLAKVASGGELSRLMLAIKCRLTSADRVGTMIFDEVDTGIGGSVAEEVGKRLKYLSEDHQVCCVTHLPQIAAMADNHYCVEKILSNNRMVTRIRKLEGQERIEEISRMLGDRGKTKTALRYAEEMIRLSSGQDKGPRKSPLPQGEG